MLQAVLLLLAASLVEGKTSTTAAASPTVTEACAQVSILSAAFAAASPEATPTVPAQLAHDCLNSVALAASAALELVESIEPYLEWQSDSAFLKDPPKDYFYPPIDIFGKLASVKSNLEADVYPNEYAFQSDLYQVFAPAHDGHYVFYPDLLARALWFGHGFLLVSISTDGKKVPKIYSYADVLAGTEKQKPSAITLINGVEASKFVQDWAYTASFNQDADAAYNSMFFSKAYFGDGYGEGYFNAAGRVRYIYPGANATYTFANGKVHTQDNIAQVVGDFTGVTDGPSFFAKFCSGATKAQSTIEAAAAPAVSVPGYPAPVLITQDAVVSGYYLEGEGFEDIAVLVLLAFENESPVEFQTVAQDFIAAAKAAGKQKIIVDVQANGGGYILQGYDMFRQFFPHIVQEDYTRIRENPTFLAVSEILSDAIPKDFDPLTTGSDDLLNDYEVVFNYRYDLNLTEQPFQTFEDKFAPHTVKGDEYTNIIRWDLNDPLTSNSTWGFGTDITGYQSRANFTQPFAAKDIIILYDGFCASTCTLFSTWMTHQGGVKTVAFGGRPNKERIQAVGGIKGAQSFGFSDIYSYAQFAAEQTTDPELLATLDTLTDTPMSRASTSGINLRDQILPGNLNDGVPAQFVKELADCRLYFTADHIKDVTAVWKSAATAAWGGGNCVAGRGFKNKKRESTAPVKRERTIAEVKMDTLRRRASLEVMERELKDPKALFKSKYGKKIVE